MEKRKLNVIFSKAGGNASKNSYNTKITLPKVWLDIMQITPEDKEIIAEFDGEKIIIKKSSKE